MSLPGALLTPGIHREQTPASDILTGVFFIWATARPRRNGLPPGPKRRFQIKNEQTWLLEHVVDVRENPDQKHYRPSAIHRITRRRAIVAAIIIVRLRSMREQKTAPAESGAPGPVRQRGSAQTAVCVADSALQFCQWNPDRQSKGIAFNPGIVPKSRKDSSRVPAARR